MRFITPHPFVPIPYSHDPRQKELKEHNHYYGYIIYHNLNLVKSFQQFFVIKTKIWLILAIF